MAVLPAQTPGLDEQDERSISELTIGELRTLIRETVQTSVAEVMIEFAAAADAEQQIAIEAEITDYLRMTMQGSQPMSDIADTWKADD